MSLAQNLATIRVEDCDGLNRASENLAAVAATLKVTKPSHLESSLRLLIEANNEILIVRDRGLRRINMYMQKQQDRLDAAARAKQSAQDAADADPEAGQAAPGDDHAA
jgi:hypothetical protein